MEELLKEILNKLDRMEEKMQQGFNDLNAKLDSYHVENIRADEKLLAAIQTTNDRLDFQRVKLTKVEEEIYLLTHKQ